MQDRMKKKDRFFFVSMEYIQPILSSMVTIIATAGEQSAVLHLSNPIYLAEFCQCSESERFSQDSLTNSMSSDIATLEGPCTQ